MIAHSFGMGQVLMAQSIGIYLKISFYQKIFQNQSGILGIKLLDDNDNSGRLMVYQTGTSRYLYGGVWRVNF